MDNPNSDDTFKLTFIYSDSDGNRETWMSEDIPTNEDDWDVGNAIKDYWWSRFRSHITVTRHQFNSTGHVTTNETQVVQYVYVVNHLKRIEGPSYDMVTAMATAATASVSVGELQPGSPPIRGTFRIRCPDWEGTEHVTSEVSWDQWEAGIENTLNNEIPHLSFNIDVTTVREFTYRDNGISFVINFWGYEADVPQCSIESGEESPMTGDEGLVFNSTTIVEYG